jgi:hypothetical protein
MPDKTAHAQQYEYKSVSLSLLTNERNNISVPELNKLGIEGWEFVTMDRGNCIFKRVRSLMLDDDK